MSVCLLVYLSVCLCINNHTFKFHHIFCTCFLWSDLALLWRQSNTLCTSVLWMKSCFHVMERMGHNQRQRVCFIQVAAPGRSLPSSTASCYRHGDRYVFFCISAGLYLILTVKFLKQLSMKFMKCWNKLALLYTGNSRVHNTVCRTLSQLSGYSDLSCEFLMLFAYPIFLSIGLFLP